MVLRLTARARRNGRHLSRADVTNAKTRSKTHSSQPQTTSDNGCPPPTAEGAFCEPADARGAHEHVDPLALWVKEQRWPQEQDWPEATSDTDATMDPPFARKKPSSTLSRKRLSSGTSATPSDQRPREEKSTPYRHQRYETLLQVRGSYMTGAPLGLASRRQALCRSLFDKIATLPSDTLFRRDIFKTTLDKIRDKNEARVIQDISRLIVPSAERLATFGAAHLDILTESVNEGWNNSIPFTSPRPQPDYSVGFKRDAFTDDQLDKLSPFLGDFIAGDQSFFMAAYYMYFPFLTCEAKCGAGALDIADRPNAHSMTVAVRGIVELFRCVKREDEVNRQILAFSISHDARSVAIYGHYPVVDGKNTKYYRHLLRMFYLAESGENDRWTAYQFTKNVYDKWMPKHYENICSAINQLPSDLEFDVAPLSETTWPSTAPRASTSEQDRRSSIAKQQATTRDTSSGGLAKRMRGGAIG